MQVLNWQDIIEKHGESVWKTSYRLLGNHQDAADCFQETFMAALEISTRQKIKNLPVEELIKTYRKYNSPEILEKIIEKNKKLAYKIAYQYKNSKHHLEDLTQIAYAGLIVAINRFDPKKNNKFSTFAYYCINGEIQHYLRDNNLINIPRWLQKLNTIFNRFIKDFQQKKVKRCS